MASILRQAAVRATPIFRSQSRAFASSLVAQKDLVQDIYLRELKAYKPPVTAKDAHVGAVKSFSTPAAPQPPALPTDLASELAAYDAYEPSIAEVPTPTATTADTTAGGAQEFLAFLEADLPKDEVHH